MIATIIISIILAVIVGLILADRIKKRKNGMCSCGCSECGKSCCHHID